MTYTSLTRCLNDSERVIVLGGVGVVELAVVVLSAPNETCDVTPVLHKFVEQIKLKLRTNNRIV